MRKRQRIGKRTGQVHFLAALDRGDDQSGEAAGNDDSYDTPDVGFSYNRLGQRLTATQTKRKRPVNPAWCKADERHGDCS